MRGISFPHPSRNHAAEGLKHTQSSRVCKVENQREFMAGSSVRLRQLMLQVPLNKKPAKLG